jgi:hydroxymethylpyrimidine pyrophosphatase-like HAD family hydrolase
VLRHKVPKLTLDQIDPWAQAAHSFLARIENARFAGIVCDFDGTCCYTPRRWDGLDPTLVDEVVRMLEAGVKIAFATGRGDSIQTDLCGKLPREHWQKVLLGYFSGSVIAWLDEEFREPVPDARFIALRSWLTEHCLAPESPSDLKICGGQMGIRLSGTLPKDAVTSAIAHWIAVNGHSGWRVFCSGHSVDVLTEITGKRHVVARFAEALGADPNEEILRVGDSGHFDGNDYELLSDGLGLSVATVSPLKTSCWNLLPESLHGAAGMHHYLSALHVDGSRVRFSEKFIEDVRTMVMNVKARQ